MYGDMHVAVAEMAEGKPAHPATGSASTAGQISATKDGCDSRTETSRDAGRGARRAGDRLAQRPDPFGLRLALRDETVRREAIDRLGQAKPSSRPCRSTGPGAASSIRT